MMSTKGRPGRGRAAAGLCATLLAAATLGACAQADLARLSSSSADKVDPTEYARADLGRYGILWTASVEHYDAELAAGDLVGDAGTELALRVADRIRLYSADGAEVADFDLPEPGLHLAFAEDVDEDGKADLVLGARRAGAASIVVARGDGSVIRDGAFVPMFEAETVPVHYQNGLIYFHASSRARVAPKIVGAFEVASGETAWVHHMGPVPRGLSVAGDGARVAVSNIAVSRERGVTDIPVAYSTSYDHHALLILGQTGLPELSIQIGPAARDGEFVDQGVSSLDAFLLDGAGEAPPTALVALQRMSSFSVGSTELRLYDLSGTEVGRFAGDPRTEVGLGYYRRGDETVIVAVFDATGRVVRLNGELEVISETVLPGAFHSAVLRGIGDYDGDGGLEYLITDDNRLLILSDELEEELVLAFDGEIADFAAFVGDGGSVSFAVLAEELSVVGLRPTQTASLVLFSEPPGARFFVDGTEIAPEDLPAVANLSPGPREVVARLGSAQFVTRVEPAAGESVEVRARFDDVPVSYRPGEGSPSPCEISLPLDYSALRLLDSAQTPDWAVFAVLGDFLAAPGLEVAVPNSTTYLWRFYDSRLNLLREVSTRRTRTFATVYEDIDGDGYLDIYRSFRGSPGRVVAVDAEGDMILDSRFFYGNDVDVRIQPPAWFAGRLLAVVQTAYLRGPDAFLGLAPPDFSVDRSYPIPSQGNFSLVHDNRLYLSQYTASNGNAFAYPDGTEVSDSEIFLNVMTADFTKDPVSRPLGMDPAHGGYLIFPFDVDDDGVGEPHFTLSRDPNYYPGPTGVYRYSKNGEIQEVLATPENESIIPVGLDTAAGPRAVLWLQRDRRLLVLDTEYRVLSDLPVSEGTPTGPTDYDQDGLVEFVLRTSAAAEVRDQTGAVLASFEPAPGSDAVPFLTPGDIDCDGRPELVVSAPGRLEVWGNE